MGNLEGCQMKSTAEAIRKCAEAMRVKPAIKRKPIKRREPRERSAADEKWFKEHGYK